MAHSVKTLISSDSAGRDAVRLSVAFIVVESLLWILIGATKTYLKVNVNFTFDILSYIADNFGNLIVAAATTAYVIFTYYLLESTEASRRHSVEPLLKIRWYQADRPVLTRLVNSGELTDSVSKWYGEIAVPVNVAELPESKHRYVIIEFSNARNVPIDQIQIGFQAKLSFPTVQGPSRNTMRDAITLKDLKLSQNSDPLAVTVMDLGCIPRTATVNAWLDTLIYGSIEDIALDKYAGEKTYETTGVWEFGPETTPILVPTTTPEGTLNV
jgi:hypothetical protein